MCWNWKKQQWPNFHWDSNKLARAESLFIENAGLFTGSSSHLSEEVLISLNVDMMLTEAISSSEIEGEYLSRSSVQASIKRAMGLKVARVKTTPAEAGIAEMVVNLQKYLNKPLTEALLFDWHRMILNGRRDIESVGGYRKHKEAMQIVSGPDYARKIHFEAPPSQLVPQEMLSFFNWYQQTGMAQQSHLPIVTRAGISHLWFESIHPFEDGNGRIGRAISEKILAEGLNRPTFILLAKVMLKHRKQYYQALSKASKNLEITEWLLWFAATVIEAQEYTQSIVHFIIEKTRLLDRVQGQLNPRQEKALLRVLDEGPEGFTGGLSAANYMSITGAPVATTTRDLMDMVTKDIFKKTGERKSTRYHLTLDLPKLKTVTVDDIL